MELDGSTLQVIVIIKLNYSLERKKQGGFLFTSNRKKKISFDFFFHLCVLFERRK